LLLPVAVLVLGFLACLGFEQMRHLARPAEAGAEPAQEADSSAV
jgi:hypothetical protein